MGLMETILPLKGRRQQVINVLTPDRYLGGSGSTPMRGLIGRVSSATRQAELRTQGTINRVPGKENHDVPINAAQGGQRPLGRVIGRRCMTRPQEGQRTT